MAEVDKPLTSDDSDLELAAMAGEDFDDPLKDYPWREEDDEAGNDELASYLEHMAHYYRDFVRTSRIYAWARTSWNFYYQLAFEGTDEIGVQALGDEGELTGVQLNHMRNLIRHLYNFMTKDKPSLRCRARNADLKSRRQADLGNGLLEYYMDEEQVHEYVFQAVEHALVIGEGFVCMTWDPTKGEAVDADPERGTMVNRGDVDLHAPVSWNVIRDLGVRDWRKHQWIGVRSPRNKWKLAATFPEHAEAIMSAEIWLDVPIEEGDRPFDDNNYLMESDEIEIYEFWHVDEEQLPDGGYALMVAGELIHRDAMPYAKLPLHRVTAAEIMLTPFGYTPAFDLIGIQEIINTIVSTLTTNIAQFGVQSLYKKRGSHLKVSQVMGGMQLVEADEEPKALQLTKSPPEAAELLNMIIRNGEIISGVDQITRGAPDQQVRSGAYAALLQSMSVQFQSSMVRSVTRMFSEIGTAIIEFNRDFADEERVITILGKHNRIYSQHFVGGDLELIERVTVEAVNPILSTNAGKIQYAEMLVKTGFIKSPEQILEVFETGSVEVLLQADKAQFSAISEENEQFLEGEEVASPMAGDHHVLHIKEHYAIFGSRQSRGDPQLVAAVHAHVMEHIDTLMTNPNAQVLQRLLGYPAPGGGPPGGGGGAPPSPPGLEGTPPDAMGGEFPPGMSPDLDGRSQVQLPEPAEPALVGA